MKYLFIICLAAFVNFQISAQRGITTTQTSHALAMGGAGINLEGINSLFHNQAGLTSIENWSVAVHAEQRFSLSELNAVSMGLAKSFKKLGSFGVFISSFGFDEYQEQKIGIAYARNLGKSISIGTQFDIFNTSIVNFGSKSLYSVEIGIIAQVVDNIQIAAHLFNPGKLELADNTSIPTRLRIGVKYNIEENIYFVAEADKRLDSPLSIHAGVGYGLIPALDLRLGFNTNPGIFSFGLAFNINPQFNIAGAYSYHEDLGITPGASIQFNK